MSRSPRPGLLERHRPSRPEHEAPAALDRSRARPTAPRMAHAGPIVIGYDGTPDADRAVLDAGELLTGREAVVVTVWKAGLASSTSSCPRARSGCRPRPSTSAPRW